MKTVPFATPKIALYQERTFGEKFSATFDFIKENWRFWLKGSCYLLLPLSLVQAFALNSLMGSALSSIEGGMDSGVGFFASYGSYFLFLGIGTVLMASFLYAMIQEYQENPNRLRDVTLQTLRPRIVKNGKRALLMSLLIGVLAVVVLALLGLVTFSIGSFWLLFFGYIGLLVVMVPLSLTLPTYIFESEERLGNSFVRGFSLGWETWGGTALLMLVMMFIVQFVQSIFMLPWMISEIVKVVFMAQNVDSAIVSSGLYSFLTYLLAVVQSFGTYLASTVTVVAVAYQYGHAAEKRDGLSVNADIEQFESLAPASDIDNFENLI